MTRLSIYSPYRNSFKLIIIPVRFIKSTNETHLLISPLKGKALRTKNIKEKWEGAQLSLRERGFSSVVQCRIGNKSELTRKSLSTTASKFKSTLKFTFMPELRCTMPTSPGLPAGWRSRRVPRELQHQHHGSRSTALGGSYRKADTNIHQLCF